MKMKSTFIGVAALLAGSSALAGGMDVSGQKVSALFEEGRYMEFSLGMVMPDVTGEFTTPLGATESGSVVPNSFVPSAAYKGDIGNGISYAVIADIPFGANVEYPGDTGYPLAGTKASVSSYAISGLLRYEFNENFSVFGGLRMQSLEASYTNMAFAPFLGGAPYELEMEQSYGFGYTAGMAFEVPDIALRAVLTYHSEIEHETTARETLGMGGVIESDYTITTPQSVNLDFQTGVAANTLVFGSVRWAEWSAVDISPPGCVSLPGCAPIVSFDDDTLAYNLGVGYKINDQWSVLGSIGYEAVADGSFSNLSPTDGRMSYTLGGVYTSPSNLKVTMGATYVNLGDDDGELSGFPVTFEDNSAIGLGLKISQSF